MMLLPCRQITVIKEIQNETGLLSIKTPGTNEPQCKKTGFQTRSDTNQSVQSEKWLAA